MLDQLGQVYYTVYLKLKYAILLDNLNVKDNSYVNNNPFDRALIAQANRENMLLLTHDKIMEYYDEDCIKIV